MGFTMRKTIQSRRSGRSLGTCQMDLQFDNDKILLPGESLPIDMEIAHSCHQSYAISEIRIRIHEVQKSRCHNHKKSRNRKVFKSDISLRQVEKAKSAAMDIRGFLDIPSSALCDNNASSRDGPVVHHYLEVKLMSRGSEENLRFQFPLAIGWQQHTSLSN
mmetsp:Transcript_12046/g.18479  ORF Transcript_12046/g.18479 Transcript_12046/m.18479 type:complete len:161 (-) Transcript_12046:152-634(-)